MKPAQPDHSGCRPGLALPDPLGRRESLGQGRVQGRSRQRRRRRLRSRRSRARRFPAPKEHAKIDQVNLVFSPHVLPVLVGTTVDFLNSDAVLHNVFTPDACAEKFNLGTWPKGQIRSYEFKKECVATLLCKVHPEMEAFVVAVPTPYFAVTKADGSYQIPDVPDGTYTVKVWHPKLKAAQKSVTVAGATAGRLRDLEVGDLGRVQRRVARAQLPLQVGVPRPHGGGQVRHARRPGAVPRGLRRGPPSQSARLDLRAHLRGALRDRLPPGRARRSDRHPGIEAVRDGEVRRREHDGLLGPDRDLRRAARTAIPSASPSSGRVPPASPARTTWPSWAIPSRSSKRRRSPAECSASESRSTASRAP